MSDTDPKVQHRWWCRLLPLRAWRTDRLAQHGREWTTTRCLICRKTATGRYGLFDE